MEESLILMKKKKNKMHFSGYLLSKLGGWRKTFFITAEMTIISLWWGIIPKWFGRRHTVWDVDWMRASCIKMENVFPTTLTSVTIVPCNYRKKTYQKNCNAWFFPLFCQRKLHWTAWNSLRLWPSLPRLQRPLWKVEKKNQSNHSEKNEEQIQTF